MPAEIDSMMYTGEVPWHRLGTKLDKPATAAEAIAAAGLDWDVQLQPIFTGPDRSVKIKGRFAVCRTDRLDRTDGGQLGVVGRNWTPLQNREAFSFLDPVVGEGGAVYHTAGSLQDGRKIWLLAQLPKSHVVVGHDQIDPYLLLSNSHDGTSCVVVGTTTVRVVCKNTLRIALNGMRGISIPHYKNVADQVRQVHRVLNIADRSIEESVKSMRQMTKVQMTPSRLNEYFHDVMPISPDDDEATRERTVRRHERLTELFDTGIGLDMRGVRDTLYAALQAVTQWTDRESYSTRMRNPLSSIWFGEGDRLKSHAFDTAEYYARTSLN